MRNRNSPRGKPWKSLMVLLVVYVLVFGFFIAHGIHWLMSFHPRPRGGPFFAQNHRTFHPFPPIDRAAGGTNGFHANAPSIHWTAATNILSNAIPGSTSRRAKPLPGDDLFRDAFIPILQIKVSLDGMSSLRRNPRRYVHASILEGATTYTNVAVRLKGGPGSFRELDDLPAFTVNFDKFAPGQTFHGLKKVHLNNSVQDRSFLAEKISRELFEAAGVPTPRAGNAEVALNDRELGMYVLVEGINKQFLKRYFQNVKGNLYDGHSGTDVTDRLPTNEGENPRDRSDLRALAEAAGEPDLNKRLASLEKVLDLDGFLSYMAMETILWHWDGYTMHRNNFRIFHDLGSDRMVFLPQGLDQVLNRGAGSIFPPSAGLVSRSVLEIPEARHRYRERLAQLSTNVFRVEAITNRIQEVADRIEAVLVQMGHPEDAEAHRERAKSFSRRIQQRARALEGQLAPVDPLKFNGLAVAPLEHWRTKLDLGEATLDEQRDADGKPLLHIATKRGCTASWRTTAPLSAGKYEFEARIKTKGVVFPPGDQRAGAGLRVSRYRTGMKNSGDRDWMPVRFEFEVHEDESEIVLVCELRASEGEVWFDEKSLRLKRE